MAKVILRPIGSPLDRFLAPGEREANERHMAGLREALVAKRAEVRAGWGPEYVQRVHEKGKLTTWERIDRLKDPGTEVLPVGTLVNYGLLFGKRPSPGAGVVTAYARVEGRWTVVIANDNTVASGSWWPMTPEKIERAQEMALRLRVPVIYLVDCSGLYLPEQARTFPGKTGAGAIFKMNSLLSAAGVPQVAGVFGDCIAGGGYMPIISDVVYMTEQAYMVIAGAALIKGGKGQHVTSLDIGGPDVHVHISACADYRVPDDDACIRRIRKEIARLSGSSAPYYRRDAEAAPPRYAPSEMDAVFPADHRMGYEIRQVLARLVDSGLFWEVLPEVGREMVCGVGRICGLYAGFIANNVMLTEHPDREGVRRPGGILYQQGIAKIAAFSRACNDDGLPLIWLHDISGFDIGEEAERQGLLGYGSSLIYTNSTNTTPMVSVLLRKASGAGYYAQAGMPYDPVLQISTPLTRLAVMEGRTLAIGTYRSRLDDSFRIISEDPAERKEVEEGMKQVEERIEKDMDPVLSARQMDTDEIVLMPEIRSYLEAVVEMAYQTYGHRRIKNPRIWSLHDLKVIAGTPRASGEAGSAAAGHLDGASFQGSPGNQGAGAHVSPEDEDTGPIPARGHRQGRGSGTGATGRPGVSGVSAGAEVMSAASRSGGHQSDAIPEGCHAVVCPADGIFYRRPRAGDPAYVEVGSEVRTGQTLGLIEAMKTFSPIPYGGPGLPSPARIVEIRVTDSQEVRHGAVIFVVR